MKQAAGYLENYLRNNYQLRVELPSLDYQPGSVLVFRLKNPRIYGGEQQQNVFLRANSIEARVPLSSLWSDPFLVNLLTVDSPELYPENLPSVRRKTGEQTEGRGFHIQKINITGGGLEYLRLQVREVALDASVDSHGVQLRDLHAKLADGELRAEGALYGYENPRYKLRYTFSGNAEGLRQFVDTMPPLSGTIRTSGDVSGSRQFYKIAGHAEAQRLSLYKETPFPAKTIYTIDTRNRAMPYEFHATWSSMPASVAGKFFLKIPLISSTINGNADYKGSKDFWNGTATAQLEIIPRAGTDGLKLAGIVNAELEDRAIHLSQTTLRMARSRVQVSGKVYQNTLQLHAKANIASLSDLAFLQLKMRQFPGSYIVDADIQGPF
ncbi:MAG TPA: hypothetical protein VI958_00980, partial [Acidobacteriota bacterium]